MGSSISMIGYEGGSALDGFISLKRGNKTGTGLIRIYHVVRPDLKVQSQAAIDLINQFGCLRKYLVYNGNDTVPSDDGS